MSHLISRVDIMKHQLIFFITVLLLIASCNDSNRTGNQVKLPFSLPHNAVISWQIMDRQAVNYPNEIIAISANSNQKMIGINCLKLRGLATQNKSEFDTRLDQGECVLLSKNTNVIIIDVHPDYENWWKFEYEGKQYWLEGQYFYVNGKPLYPFEALK